MNRGSPAEEDWAQSTVRFSPVSGNELRCESCGQPVSAPVTDRLTGLLDRRGWELRAPRVLAGACRARCPSSLLAVDLDRFRRVNECYGDATGDRILRSVADTLRMAARKGDLLARYLQRGGDEFLLLLPRTPVGEALVIAERIQAKIKSIGLTASIGMASCLAGQTCELRTLMADATAALRKCKQGGRDQIQVTSPFSRLLQEACENPASPDSGNPRAGGRHRADRDQYPGSGRQPRTARHGPWAILLGALLGMVLAIVLATISALRHDWPAEQIADYGTGTGTGTKVTSAPVTELPPRTRTPGGFSPHHPASAAAG
ncbi:GGDEF domain-containing protein [Amycolatopsis aidingensis]|uniref:GGDEF domain-containing protein n=1 Tax=Amycolatopsis aidingensis TaxID=2842453 RepID=UPI001C0C4F6F|nr:GGDEF domain-containing protein [Amycolatopsis aidingensis]